MTLNDQQGAEQTRAVPAVDRAREAPAAPRAPAGSAIDQAQEVPPVAQAPEAPAGDSGDPEEKVSIRRIIWTTSLCAAIGLVAHILIYVGYLVSYLNPDGRFDALIPYQLLVGAATAVIGVIAFGGFYSATLRARVAIASSVLISFLLLLSFDLAIVELFRRTGDVPPSQLTADLRQYVGTVIAFYFGSEALISGTKAIGAAFGRPENVASVMTSDRDVARRPASAASELGAAARRGPGLLTRH